MNPSEIRSTTATDNLTSAFEEYVRLCEEGNQPDLESFLRQSAPEIRDELDACLTAYQFVERIASNFDGDVSADNKLPQDRLLGDYRIIREIGRGGMGVVFEAHQISLDRPVALKILPLASLLSEQQIERFRNEARAAASLRHPNIVGVHGVGVERAVHFYAMELVQGCDLANLIREVHKQASDNGSRNGKNRLPKSDTQPIAELSTQRASKKEEFFRSVGQLGIQAAHALHHAHQTGVIHRDIKPANLLVDENGNIRITDFGLARIQAEEGLSQTGDLVGTLRYMSPEQINGDHVDARTDVYSLGVTLYELSCGKAAFPAESRPQLMEAITKSEPPRLRTIDPEVPIDLQIIIEKATSSEPTDRYHDAQQLANDLSRFLEHRTIAAKPATLLTRFSRFAKRNPAVTTLLATTTVLFALLAAGASAVAWNANVRAKKTTAQAAVEIRKNALREYASDMRFAQVAIDNGRFLEAEHLLMNWVPESHEEDLRNIEWYHLWERGHPKDIMRTIVHTMAIYDADFSPDQKKLAVASFNNAVRIWDLTKPVDAPPERILGVGGMQVYIAETLGDLLVLGGDKGEVVVHNWNHLEADPLRFKVGETFSSSWGVGSVDVDPNGKLLAIGGSRGTDELGYAEVWDLETGKKVFQRTNLVGDAFVCFDSDGRLIVCVRNSSRATQFSMDTGECIAEFDLEGAAYRARRSHDRRHLALALTRDRGETHDSWVELRDLKNWSNTRHLFNLPNVNVRSFGYSHSNDRLSVGDLEGRLWTVRLDSGKVSTRRLHDCNLCAVTYSPNDAQLVTNSLDRHLHVIDATWDERSWDASRVQFPAPEKNAYRSATFLDNQRIAVTRGTQNVDVYDAQSCEVIERWGFDVGPNPVLKANPARKLLATVELQWPYDFSKPDEYRGLVTVRDYDQNVVASCEAVGGFFAADYSITPDGRYLAFGNPKGVVIIDVENSNSPVRYIPCKPGVKATAFSSDSKALAFAQVDGLTHFVNTETLTPIRDPFHTGRKLPDDMSWIPGTNLLAVVGFENRLKIYDVDSGVLVRESKQYPYFFNNVVASPDGKRVGVGSMNGRYRLFRTEDCIELLSFSIETYHPRASFSPDGEKLLISNGAEVVVVNGRCREIEELTVAELYEIVCRDRTEISGW